MKRIVALLFLIGVVSLPVGCDSPKSAPAAPSSGGSSNSFTYPFAGNIGSYFNNQSLSSTDCPGPYPYPGQFSDITGIAVSGDYVFVGDDDWGDIQVFDTHGNFITWFWPDTSFGDYTQYIGGMYADKHGHLYVADYDYSVISVYNVNDILTQAPLSSPCNDVAAFGSYNPDCSIDDIAVDDNGNIYAADAGCSEIYVFAPDFSLGTNPNVGSDAFNGSSSGDSAINGGNIDPVGIAVNSDGSRIYVADQSANGVQVYDGDFNWLSFIGEATGAPTTVAGQFDHPTAVRLDNQGNLLVVDSYNSRVQRLTTSGTVLNVIGWYGSHTTPQSGDLYSPLGLAVDANDDLFVTDNNLATVFKYTSH